MTWWSHLRTFSTSVSSFGWLNFPLWSTWGPNSNRKRSCSAIKSTWPSFVAFFAKCSTTAISKRSQDGAGGKFWDKLTPLKNSTTFNWFDSSAPNADSSPIVEDKSVVPLASLISFEEPRWKISWTNLTVFDLCLWLEVTCNSNAANFNNQPNVLRLWGSSIASRDTSICESCLKTKSRELRRYRKAGPELSVLAQRRKINSRPSSARA